MKFNHRLDATIVVAVVIIAAACDGCPRIVSRAEWGALPPAGPVSKLTIYPAPYVVVHHTAGVECFDQNSCSVEVRNIQHQHISGNKWSDIGYNFLIGSDGTVYEGRGWGQHGAHAPKFNSRSHGIVFIGNYMDHLPTDAAINAFHALIKCGIDLKYVTPKYNLVGHRQGRATLCPGDKLFELIEKWPHFTPHPSYKVEHERGAASDLKLSLPNYCICYTLFAWSVLFFFCP